MRIGYILNVFPKLSETFVVNEIVELLQRNHEVYIFSLSHSYERIFQPEVKVHNLISKTHYLPFEYKAILPFTRTMQSNAKIGKSYFPSAQRLYCTVAARFFSRIVKRLDLDIIHAHFANEATYTAMLISKFVGIPFTFTAHAVDIFDRPDIESLREKAAKSSAIITISNFNRNYIHELTGVSLEKIHVIRACPSSKFINIRREIPVGNCKHILTVARLVEKKGINYGILAVKKLSRKFPDIEYRIVGAGPLEARLKSLVESLDLEENVKMLGELDASRLVDEYKKATLFMLPCIRTEKGDMDGIPISLMEAMCLRIPVISTNISGIPELIEHGKSGLLVREKNVDQLAEAVETLLQNESLASNIGSEARKKIVEGFNVHDEVGRLVHIWENIRNPVKP